MSPLHDPRTHPRAGDALYVGGHRYDVRLVQPGGVSLLIDRSVQVLSPERYAELAAQAEGVTVSLRGK